MSISTEQLLTVMRPLVGNLERALRRLLEAGLTVPTQPVPRIESTPDGSGGEWIDAEVDFWRLRRDGMTALESSTYLLAAEWAIAKSLGIEAEPEQPAERPWTPQGQVVDVFLEDYLRSAYGEEGNLHMAETLRAVEDPSDTALRMQVERLARFLAADSFTGQLVVPLGGVRLSVERLQVEPGMSVVPFTTESRDKLWRVAGRGSAAAQPLQSHEFFDVAQAVSVDIWGTQLGGWDWFAALAMADRLRLALLVCGAASVRAGLAWLRLDEQFASYLSRLGASSGLVRQTATAHVGGRTRLSPDQTAQLPDVYARLAHVPRSGALPLALRRLTFASERNSPHDRLIDNWIAFEALFARDRERSRQTRHRIARYVGADADEQRELGEGLGRAYKWRSHVVHGGVADEPKMVKQLGPLTDAVALSDRVLRAALRRGLLAPSESGDASARFLA